MTVVAVYLWLCFGVAAAVSLTLGMMAFLGGGVTSKNDSAKSPWPLMGAIVGVSLAVQAGYLAAPLAVVAGGEWWRWAVAGMAPLGCLSLCVVAGWVGLLLRSRVRGGAWLWPRPGVAVSVVVQAAVYAGAPLVVWLARV